MSEKIPELDKELTEAEARATIVPENTGSGNERGTPWTFGDLFDRLNECGEIKDGVTIAQFVKAFLASRHSDY